MAAALDDTPVVEHDDLVGVNHGRQPVRNDRASSDARATARSADWISCSVRVSSALVASSKMRMRGSFRIVRAIATRCFSPPGQLQAALAHPRVVPVRQAQDEVMHLRQPRRLLDLGLAGAGPAIGDVVADRVVEQHGVLRHHADRRAQAVLRHVADILPVDQ